MIQIAEFTMYDEQYLSFIDKLSKVRQRTMTALLERHNYVYEKTDSVEGVFVKFHRYNCIAKVYYFNENEIYADDRIEYFKEKTQVAYEKRGYPVFSAATILSVHRRGIKSNYQYNTCRFELIHPGGELGTYQSSLFRFICEKRVEKTDGNYLVGKDSIQLIVSLVGLFTRTYMTTSLNDQKVIYIDYLKNTKPDMFIKDYNVYKAHDNADKSDVNGESYSVERLRYTDINLLNIDHRESRMPNDVDTLINKYFQMSIFNQYVFSKASDAYKMGLKYFYDSPELAISYFVIALESIAKSSLAKDDVRKFQKKTASVDYFKAFVKNYMKNDENLESILNEAYRIRCLHLHEGNTSDGIWANIGETFNSKSTLENLTQYILIKWLIEREVIVNNIFEKDHRFI